MFKGVCMLCRCEHIKAQSKGRFGHKYDPAAVVLKEAEVQVSLLVGDCPAPWLLTQYWARVTGWVSTTHGTQPGWVRGAAGRSTRSFTPGSRA